MWIHYNLLVHAPVDHLGCFPVLAISSKGVRSTHIQVSVWTSISFSLGKIPVSGGAGSW